MKNIKPSVFRIAKAHAEVKVYEKEWKSELFLLHYARIFLGCISIVTGFAALNALISPLISDLYVRYSLVIIFLSLLEIAAQISITKSWKFLLRNRFVNFCILIFITLICFSISFLLSTSGIHGIAAEKISNEDAINVGLVAVTDSISNKYSSRIEAKNNDIAAIRANPLHWRGGISKEQTASIEKIQNKIDALEVDLKTELEEAEIEHSAIMQVDTEKKNNAGNDYYHIVGGLQFLLVVISFIIGYMSYQIYKKAHENDILLQDLQEMQQHTADNINTIIISQQAQTINTALEQYRASANFRDEQLRALSIPNNYEIAANDNKEIVGNEKKKTTASDLDTPGTTESENENTNTKSQKPTRNIQTVLGNQQNAKQSKSESNMGVNERNEGITLKNYGFGICVCNRRFIKRAHNQTNCSTYCRHTKKEIETGKDRTKYKVKFLVDLQADGKNITEFLNSVNEPNPEKYINILKGGGNG